MGGLSLHPLAQSLRQQAMRRRGQFINFPVTQLTGQGTPAPVGSKGGFNRAQMASQRFRLAAHLSGVLPSSLRCTLVVLRSLDLAGEGVQQVLLPLGALALVCMVPGFL